ncbi:hypothetical protein ANN_01647 [Periplaneta americana]|uniref:Uncharacterized protein n=1 Tax=Periplaneta americana TaxID=6978 RepID=A0ABQ8TWJ4_PERAM|nr:hypothetical protein ANN_01647 [Periplaneta americana]
MAGLCEDGSEPASFLKAICKTENCIHVLQIGGGGGEEEERQEEEEEEEEDEERFLPFSHGSSTDSYPAFAHIELRENPGKTSTRPIGKSRKRWKDSIKEDCQQLLKCRNWEVRARDREDWRQRIKKARARFGL